MHTAIHEFVQYAGLTGLSLDASGQFSMQLESGTTINIEPDQHGEHLIVSVFYPSPWKLLELGERALRRVHYREANTLAIAAGIYEDRLVLSTRLSKHHQAPQVIERAAHSLYQLAQQCAQHAELPSGGQGEDRAR